MKLIEITQGYYTLVSDRDFKLLNQYSWYAKKTKNTVYALTNIQEKTIQKARLIMNPKKYEIVDHINMNGLDNRRRNLRLCTRSQNRMNTLKYDHNKAGYKGVHKCRSKKNPYRSQIRFKSKIYHLGCFKTAKEAALAYNKKAKELFKKFYRGNNV